MHFSSSARVIVGLSLRGLLPLHAQARAVPDSQLVPVTLRADSVGAYTPLAWMLWLGRRIALDTLPGANPRRGVDAALWARVFEGDCIDGTHAECGHNYWLVFAGDGEGYGPYVFNLGFLGQLTPLRWLPGVDTVAYLEATLLVEVQNYPEYVFTSTPSAVRVRKRYQLTLAASEGRLDVRPVP